MVVWKLDRLSRSLKDVLHIMERIAQAGAGFRSLTEAIDTTTPAGRMMMQMVGSFAEFERAMIRNAPRRVSPPPALRVARRPTQEARRRQEAGDRRERHHRPQVRCRHGSPLQCQPAHRLTDRGPVPDHRFVTPAMGWDEWRTKENASLEEAAPEGVDNRGRRKLRLLQRCQTGAAWESFLSAITGRGGDTATAKAQDVMYDAWEQTTSRSRIALARKALGISPLCADAYVLLAEEAARSIEEARDYYAKGVEAGELALGPEGFKEYAGHFWGFLQTRPDQRGA